MRHLVKVLQLSKYYPPYLGGIETHVFNLTEELEKQSFDVEVIASNSSVFNQIDIFSYKVTRVGTWFTFFSAPICPLIIWEIFKRRRDFDIIHAHLPNPIINLALYITRPSAKIVIHWHSDIVKNKLLALIYWPLHSWLLNKSSAIICTTQAYADSSMWLRPYMSKVKIVPYGIREPKPKIESKNQHVDDLYSQLKGHPIILGLGRLVSFKGFEVLIDATNKLKYDAKICIAGDGPLWDKLQQKIIEMHLVDKVYMLGSIQHDEIDYLFSIVNVLCLPSLHRAESFGIVMLEAMANRIPIVASQIDGSGVSWVNQHNVTGLNVIPNDPDELANAINIILSDAQLSKQFSENGRHRYHSEFRLDTMVDKTIRIYKSILN